MEHTSLADFDWLAERWLGVAYWPRFHLGSCHTENMECVLGVRSEHTVEDSCFVVAAQILRADGMLGVQMGTGIAMRDSHMA